MQPAPARPRREFTYSDEQFADLVTTDHRVDLRRLRQAARHGVPASSRRAVWRCLLGLGPPEHDDQVEAERSSAQHFTRLWEEGVASMEIATRRRILKDIKKLTSPDTRLEPIIVAFLRDQRNVHYRTGMLYMLTPLLEAFPDEKNEEFEESIADVFAAYRVVMEEVHSVLSRKGLENVMARFIMLFRTFLTDLCEYFEDEGLPFNEWAVSWIDTLLARQLPLKCVLRLWDTYFADSIDVDFHVYVCLAILECLSHVLMELDYSEIRAYLRKLPELDMDRIIVQAQNIRDDAAALYAPKTS